MAMSFGITPGSEQYRELERRFNAEQQKKAEKPQLTGTKEERIYNKVLDIALDRYNAIVRRGFWDKAAEIR